jgi:hypothetical protein
VWSNLEDKGVFAQLGFGDAQRGEEAGDGDRGGALDVVVEGAVLVAVLLKETEGVVVAEVFELDQSVLAVPAHHRLHELLDELVVFCSNNALLTQTNVQRVVQQLLRKNYTQTYFK